MSNNDADINVSTKDLQKIELIFDEKNKQLMSNNKLASKINKFLLLASLLWLFSNLFKPSFIDIQNELFLSISPFVRYTLIAGCLLLLLYASILSINLIKQSFSLKKIRENIIQLYANEDERDIFSQLYKDLVKVSKKLLSSIVFGGVAVILIHNFNILFNITIPKFIEVPLVLFIIIIILKFWADMQDKKTEIISFFSLLYSNLTKPDLLEDGLKR